MSQTKATEKCKWARNTRECTNQDEDVKNVCCCFCLCLQVDINAVFTGSNSVIEFDSIVTYFLTFPDSATFDIVLFCVVSSAEVELFVTFDGVQSNVFVSF